MLSAHDRAKPHHQVAELRDRAGLCNRWHHEVLEVLARLHEEVPTWLVCLSSSCCKTQSLIARVFLGNHGGVQSLSICIDLVKNHCGIVHGSERSKSCIACFQEYPNCLRASSHLPTHYLECPLTTTLQPLHIKCNPLFDSSQSSVRRFCRGNNFRHHRGRSRRRCQRARAQSRHCLSGYGAVTVLRCGTAPEHTTVVLERKEYEKMTGHRFVGVRDWLETE